jgi:hypothetical protein
LTFIGKARFFHASLWHKWNRFLRSNSIIQRFLAAGLLILITLVTLPKTYLHDLLAGHHDTISCEQPIKARICLHQQDINCQFSNVLVVSGFILTESAPDSRLPIQLFSEPVQFQSSHSSTYLLHFDSRGPPAIG